MGHHPVLWRRALAASLCVLVVGIAAASLAWLASPRARPAADRSDPRGQSVLSLAPPRDQPLAALLDSAAAARAVREAWQRARDAGIYGFSTDLTQLAYPARSLANSGRGPQTVELRLEGEVDLPARSLGLRLWEPGDAGAADGRTEARVEGGRAYLRAADGSWQEVEDFTTSFAPDNDPLAFLGGMEDVREVAALEQAADAPLSRFAFRLDGPKLADYLRDQLQRRLTERGELPPGVSLDVPASLRQMTGSGEVWVDQRGLPLRLTMHLAFPRQRDGSWVEADVQTRFSGYPQQVEAAGNALGATSQPGSPRRALRLDPGEMAAAGALALGTLLAGLLFAGRRSRRAYAAVVMALLFSMVVVPQMQAAQVAAFYDRQAARPQELPRLHTSGQAVSAAASAESDAYQAIAEQLAPAWDPLADPLAAAANAASPAAEPRPLADDPPVEPPALSCNPDDTADSDGDGVNNYEECVYWLDAGDPDYDDDGLDDGQELNKLATDPSAADTDGDGVSDAVEVRGFPLGGRTWFLNPNNPDSNNDGQVDAAECPVLLETPNPTADQISAQCDADQDDIPNPFEFDNDDDGVPDVVDLSPDEAVDTNGKRHGQPAAATAFNRDHPFRLSVTNLASGWPVLVDLQMRPVVADHLAYALNVYDWPENDVDGQIQHKANTTFYSLNPQDASGANGDMRLVPLLEIAMTGPLPLKLADPSAQVIVGAGTALSTTVTIDAASATSTRFRYALPANARLDLYAGTCGSLGAQPLLALTGASATLSARSVVQTADGSHALVITDGTTPACAELPDVVNGPYADKMVDESALAAYGVTASDQGDGSVLVYVPLNVTSDDTGGGKSAFQARMIYWPGETNRWVEAQSMRIIWLVQMLTDSCAEGYKSYDEYVALPGNDKATQQDYDAYFDDWCARNRTADEIVPVQVYDEDWFLTGLVAREDHGLDLAVAYVNPALSPYNDDALYTLSMGLGEQFIAGVDCDTAATILSPTAHACVQDNLRDLAVSLTDHAGQAIANSTIEQRFDLDSTAPITTRWGIPLNALQVETHRYDHQDYLARHSMTQTPRILAQFPVTATPTILAAREERYRSARLEAAAMPAGGALTLDLSSVTYPERTLAGLQWTTYRHGEAGWEAFPATEYWDILEAELLERFRRMYPLDPESANVGRMALARAYNLALINGVVNTVVHCTPDQLLCPIPGGAPYTNVMIIRAVRDMQNGLDALILKIAFKTWEARKAFRSANVQLDLERNGQVAAVEDALDELNDGLGARGHPEKRWYSFLGDEIKGYFVTPYKTIWSHGTGLRVTAGIVIGAAICAVIATIVVAAALKAESAQVAAIVVRSISLLIATHCVISAISGMVEATAKALFQSVTWAIRQNLGLWKNLKLGGVVTAGLQVLVTWGAFAAMVLCNHMDRGGLAFDNELAFAVASMVVTVVLFVIFTALGPLGVIIQAILGMLNAIANLICSALPEDMQRSKAGYWLCGGITGFITNALKWLIYSGTIMVEMNPTGYERLATHGFASELRSPNDGMVAGNAIRYSISLTNTINLVKVPISLYEIGGHTQFSDETLARATFDYKWQQAETDYHDGLSLGGMVDDWLKTDGGRPFYYTETVWTAEPFPLSQTGVNRPVPGLYLSEAYAVPEQECWIVTGCDIKAEKGTYHYDLGADLRYDVLPATLHGFCQLAARDDGYALAWGQSGDLTFATLRDADGDGLTRLEDPNDSRWDADGDGLSDAFEIEGGTNPLSVDTDNDGLSDLEEARHGSDPNRADGDGDGLYDCQEVRHQVTVAGDSVARAACGEPGTWSGGWSVVYGKLNGVPLTTWVTSSPTDPDTEADGLTDAQERTYGYNPQAISSLNVLTLRSELSELSATGGLIPSDTFVAPGQTLYYTATVQNQLDNRQAQGLLSTRASLLDNSSLLPQSFVLRPKELASLAGNLRVPSAAASGTGTVTQVAGASIVNLQDESGQAALWLRFDDAAGSLVYEDSSGADPPHDGQCVGTGCALDPAAGRVGGALRLNGSSAVRSAVTVPNAAYSVSFWFKVDAAHSASGVLFATELTDRARLYLSGGKVVAATPGGQMTSARALGDDAWHHAVHVDPGAGGSGQQVLYIDGVPAAAAILHSSPTALAQAGALLGGKAGSYLTGALDDLRLFERVLTAAEVEQLASQPLFHMSFDQTDRWSDVSSYRTTVESCRQFIGVCLPYGPTHDANAISGYSASLDGAQYLSVPAASQLDLSAGRFTLSAWVFPRNHGDSRDAFPQGILGLKSGDKDAYPTLQRVGRKVRFSLGTGAAWHAPYTSGDVLALDQWNHVAVTLDKAEAGGTLRLYVNARLVETAPFAVTDIAPASSFEIGRTSNTGRVELTRFYQGSFHDEGMCQTCGELCKAEMCMAMNETEVFDWQFPSCGLTCPGGLGIDCPAFPQGVSFSNLLTLKLWEDDRGTRCGAVPETCCEANDDDTCEIGASNATSLEFSTNDAGFDSQTYTFDSCNSDGEFRLRYTHDSVPFFGRLDEVQIYGHALDQDAIIRLYLDPATLLRLPLDEAPGATAFEDASLARVPASCSGSACPASGALGRINQAAEFSRAGGSAITLGRSSANLLVSSFTVAAWVKPNSLPASARIVSTARTRSNNGWGFGLSGSNLTFDLYGQGAGFTSSAGVQVGRWTHVAAVVNADYTITFYINGQPWALGGHMGAYGAATDMDDLLLVGATTEIGSAAPSQVLDGQLDDLWVLGMALTAEQVQRLYQRAPLMHLRLDEAHGAAQFADNAAPDRQGTCAAGACPVTGEGVRGQVGLAAQFDGADDRVALADSAALRPTAFSVGAWVMPAAASQTPVAGLLHELVGKWSAGTVNYRLYLSDDLKPGLEWGCAGTDIKVNAGSPLIEAHWNHVLGTFDGLKLRLYVNGIEAASHDLAATGACTSDAAVELGGKAGLPASQFFNGALDEVVAYGRALTPAEVHELYRYQAGWVEDRQVHEVTVDNDAPTAELLPIDPSYLPNRPVWVGVIARDATSGVSKVELGVQKAGGTIAWTPAERCAESLGFPAGAWCPQFAPSGEGQYALWARATDRVGKAGLSTPITVYVDDSPPDLTLDQTAAQLNAQESKGKKQHWTVRLSGYVHDKFIPTNLPGSGVPPDGVRVTLRDGDGKKVGDEGQVAAVANKLWSLDYTIPSAKADGCLTIEVEAMDRVAEQVKADSQQLARHRKVVTSSVVLDASAPKVALDRGSIGNKIGAGTLTLGGAISARPAPVRVALTGGAGADTVRARLTCQHGNEGSWYTLFDLAPGALASGRTDEWLGDIHLSSSCEVALTSSAASAEVSGVIEVCGARIASWTGSFAGSKAVPFVVLSDACGAPGCSTDAPVAGVAGVEVAFVPALPGSAFINEPPAPKELLHLPFEDTPDQNGALTLRDVSSYGVNGSCSADACPSPGQPSPAGSGALFDGVNDVVRVAQVAGQGTSTYLTIAAWVYPNGTPANRGAFLSRDGLWEVACLSDGNIRWAFRNDVPGWTWTDTGYRAPLNRWTHIAIVYNAGVITTYANGAQVHTLSGSGLISNASALSIGGYPANGEWFGGMLDEVRVYGVALSPSDIGALYTGSGPLLALSFEEPWLGDGDRVADGSGWANHGVLRAGASDAANKSRAGQVGGHALSLDGVDDYVDTGDWDAADTFTDFSLSQWFSLDALRAPGSNQDWAAPVAKAANGTTGWAVMVNRDLNVINNHRVRLYINGVPTANILAPEGGWQPGRWYHYAFARRSGVIKGYLDGVEKVTVTSATKPIANSLPVTLGKQGATYYWEGALDELRFYRRALPPEEIADLYHAGWQAATLAQTGNAVASSRWTIAVPPGLEGVYDLAMRGRDVAGHAEVAAGGSVIWRGEADNLAPRLALCRTVESSTTYRYHAIARDLSLTEQGFVSPCPISTRTYFRSPWYVAGTPPGTQRLYGLTAYCDLGDLPAAQATACDTAGNCATVGLSSPDVCNAMLLAQDDPGRDEGARLELAVARAAAEGRPLAPVVAFASTVITATRYTPPAALGLTGYLTGAAEVSAVEVAIGGSSGQAALSAPEETWPFTRTWSVAYLWPEEALPDGVARTAVVTATLDGAPIAQTEATLTLDVVPPAAVELTLTGNGAPLAPGAIVREAAPDLALAWTPSADGSGLAPYLSAWRIWDPYTTTTTIQVHDPAGPPAAHLAAGEAQVIALGLASRDLLGNQRWQRYGAVVVDGPLTPDLLLLPAGAGSATAAQPYAGWMDSGCSLMGADERASLRQSAGGWAAQQLHATWDARALRLAWTGADWDGDGDLFIYLDTGAGGTDATFTPYPLDEAATHVLLPPGLPADRLIWVQDGRTATLLRWDGAAWAAETPLSAEQYQYHWSPSGGQTDLVLPFALLGIGAGDALGLLAFATEEPAPAAPLRLWATLPAANPVNSPRSNPRAFLVGLLEGQGARVPLLHFYHWASLGDGVCPNGTAGAAGEPARGDVQLRATIAADPPGAAVSGVGGGVFWTGDPEGALAALGSGLVMEILSAEHAPLLDGQPITYTLRIANEGSDDLQGAWLEFRAFGQLRLLEERADLGDIPAGGERAATVHGLTDRAQSEVALAVALARLFDASHQPGQPALEWMVAANRVDRGGPEQVGLHEAGGLVGPGAAWLSGVASDESGISRIEVEILAPSGLTSTVTCDVARSASGYWTCPWDVVEANGGAAPEDGDAFTLRLRAADRLGHVSNWTAPYTIRVDALPPGLRLASEIAGAWAGRVVNGSSLRLIGETWDNSAVGSVTICVDGAQCRTADLAAAGAASSRWSRWITLGGALDYVTKTLTIEATDRLGNRMVQGMAVPVVFDNAPPALTAQQRLAQARLGSSEIVLSGQVHDGGPSAEVSVRVESPGGAKTRLAAARDGDSWSFALPAGLRGSHTLWVEAKDAAGNVAAAGPFTVEVTCANAAPVVTRLTAEPAAGAPRSLALTALLYNAGPDPLPAGTRIALAEGGRSLGEAATTAPLGSGEAQALSVLWAPEEARRYDLTVAALAPAAGAPAAPLCEMAAPAQFTLWVRDLPLYAGLNLVGPPLRLPNDDVQVAQRGIAGDYAVLIGYDGALLTYDPARPEESTLDTVAAGDGCWVRLTSAEPPTQTVHQEPLAAWRLAGEALTGTARLPLDAGWNLIGYLPQAARPVSLALQSIEGAYAAVLGFDRTGLSYYPDLDRGSGYNTLARLAPAAGYWISATQAITLAYALDDVAPPEANPTLTETVAYANRLQAIRLAEEAAGVRPTYAWLNLYGRVHLADGRPAPVGATVTAWAGGAACGATVVTEAGRFGLLACYRDDATTPEVDGARRGEAIELRVDGEPAAAWALGHNGRPVEGAPPLRWTAHGDRWEVLAGTPHRLQLPRVTVSRGR